MYSFIPHTNKNHSWRTAFFILAVTGLSAAIVLFAQGNFKFPNILKTDVFIQKNDSIGYESPIIVEFSLPVVPSKIEKAISIYPKQKMQFRWENKHKRLIISPEGYWKPETNYAISISKGKNIFFSSFDAKIYFSTKLYPAVESTVPINGEKNVEISMENPVIFEFDRDMDEFDLKFEVSPEKQVQHQVDKDQETVRLVSQSDFEYNTEYAISIFIKLKQQPDSEYHEAGETIFATAFPPMPAERSKNAETLLKEAMMYTKPQITTGKYIDISLEFQNLVIFEDGKALSAHLISSGKRRMETPQGEFRIENKTPRAWSKKYGLFMPYWMAFLPSGQMGIHELPEWPGGYKEGRNHLGIPVSHGCVRLGIGDAKEVYEWAEIGTPVIIHS